MNGSTPLRSNKDFWTNGDVPWFTVDDIREQGRTISYTRQTITKQALGKTSTRLLPAESVLICCTASVGEYAITKIPLTTNQQFNGLVIKDKKILSPYFLFYFASTLKDQLLNLSGKTTIDFIPISRLKDIDVLFPSLAEQKRIVKKLDEVFEQVIKAKEAAEKNLQNAKELFESYLNGVFANPGKGWQKKKLGDITDYLARGVSPKYISKGGVFVLNQKCVRNHEVSYREARRHDDKNKKYDSSKQITVGDVLVNSTGVGTLGRVAQVKSVIEPTIVDSHITIVRPQKNLFFDPFFGWAMVYVEDLIKELGSGASGQTELSRTTLKELEIAYTESIAEQKSIVKKLDAMYAQTKKLEKIYEQKLADLEELKKSILSKAFHAEL